MPGYFDLSGKVVLITGGGRGQGAHEAALMAAHGARVILADVDDEAGTARAAAIPGAAYLHLDIASPANWEKIVRQIRETHGRLDVLVNNAAILAYGSIEETPLEDLRRLLSVNLEGAFLGMQKTLDLFPAEGGSIINICSISGAMGRPGQIGYLLSKWALRGLSKAAALEFAPRRIRVNTILPGLIATPMSEGRYGEDGVAAMGKTSPIGRAGTPDDIGQMVLFLASDRSSFCNGTELICDGGVTAGM